MASGGIPSPKELDNLSKEICDCWQSLGIQLDVERARINSIRDDNVQFASLEKKAFAMLNSWYDKGSGSTFDVLSEALRNMDKARLAEKYCGKESKSKCTTPRHSEDNICYSASEHVSVEILSPAGHEVETVTVTVRVRGQSPANSPLDIHVTKRLPHEYKALFSFGSQGLGEGQFRYPHGIAVNRAGEIAVLDSHGRVQIFSAGGQYVRTFGKLGTQEDYRYPSGFAYNKAGNIIIGDRRNSKIRVFSPTGCCIDRFGQDVLKEPLSVSVTGDGNIVVCDYEQNVVNVFSPKGVLILQFSTGSGPRCAIFCDDKYFVSFVDMHLIKVFDSSGARLYDIDKLGNGTEQSTHTAGLAVDIHGLLLVCDDFNNRVQVVTLDGEFVTSFGSRGSGLGQFISSHFIAVSRDGRVFVTDFDNHRVQVFEAQY